MDLRNATWLFLLLLLRPFSGSAGKGQPVPDQPLNILFVLADDWSWPHAGYLGDRTVKTPVLDSLARLGVVFSNAFCAVPSCTPSRASLLTGRYAHQLGEGANLWGPLSIKYPNYTLMLEEKGYAVGYERKGWFPAKGKIPEGYPRNPAGHLFTSFEEFLAKKPAGQPFCYWFGSNEPHRSYDRGSGKAAGLDLAGIKVPGWLPDAPEVRNDLADYYLEIQTFDRDAGRLLALLKEQNLLENTLIVVTSDNGMPFPRAKANLYDAGTRMPLILCGPGPFRGGKTVDALVSHVDLAPTFLEAAGLAVPREMTGKSLLPLVKGEKPESGRDRVFFERERHGNVRRGDLAYPCRGVRTKDFLLILNLRPDRWPAGDSVLYWSHGPYGDVDGSPSKQFILANRAMALPGVNPSGGAGKVTYYQLAFGLRPAVELYDLRKDPEQLNNVAADPAYRKTLDQLTKMVTDWMRKTGDPLAAGEDDPFEKYPFYGNPASQEPKAGKQPAGAN